MLTFQAEIDAFQEALPQLLADQHEGEFAVLKSRAIEHLSPTYEHALRWGYERYGLDEEFLVKQVLKDPQATHFRRLR